MNGLIYCDAIPERAQIKAEMEEQYKSILEKNQQEMEEMRKTFEEKLKASVRFNNYSCILYVLISMFTNCL